VAYTAEQEHISRWKREAKEEEDEMRRNLCPEEGDRCIRNRDFFGNPPTRLTEQNIPSSRCSRSFEVSKPLGGGRRVPQERKGRGRGRSSWEENAAARTESRESKSRESLRGETERKRTEEDGRGRTEQRKVLHCDN